MGLITNINGFRCTNHEPEKKKILSGKFDLDNPCSWCKNRQSENSEGPSFYYAEFGRWEFPFVAEANCANYSLIWKSEKDLIDATHLDMAKNIHKIQTHISSFGRAYEKNWWEFDSRKTRNFNGINLKNGMIYYPNEMSGVEFYKEANELRTDIFEFRHEMKRNMEILRKQHGIYDSAIDDWLEVTGKSMRELSNQIDYLEDNPRKRQSTSVYSKWGVNTIRDGLAWDSIKSVLRIIKTAIIGI